MDAPNPPIAKKMKKDISCYFKKRVVSSSDSATTGGEASAIAQTPATVAASTTPEVIYTEWTDEADDQDVAVALQWRRGDKLTRERKLHCIDHTLKVGDNHRMPFTQTESITLTSVISLVTTTVFTSLLVCAACYVSPVYSLHRTKSVEARVSQLVDWSLNH